MAGRPLARRTLIGAAAGLPLVSIGSGRTHAAEFTYKLATGQTITQPINARLEQATGRIREATGGGSRSASFRQASSAPTRTC